MPESAVKAAERAVAVAARANANGRQRAVGIAVLVAIGLLLYRYLRSTKEPRKSIASHGPTSEAPPQEPPQESLSLPEDKDAEAVRTAAVRYGEAYQARMRQMVFTSEEVHAHPFIGFSIADNIRPGQLVVDGVFEEGPAFQVGVDIDHELVAIAGERATDVETVRALVAKHCKPGRVTHFTFYNNDRGERYEADVWVMTADEEFRGKPYFFASQEHEVRQSDRLKQTWRPGGTP